MVVFSSWVYQGTVSQHRTHSALVKVHGRNGDGCGGVNGVSCSCAVRIAFFPTHITLFISIENHLPFYYSCLPLQNTLAIFHVQLEYLRFIGKCFILLAGYFTSMLNSWETNMCFLCSSKNVHKYIIYTFFHALYLVLIFFTLEISLSSDRLLIAQLGTKLKTVE